MENILSFFNSVWEFLLNIKELFRENHIFSIGLLLIVGYFLSRLTEKIKLPAIGGYILAGFILGDSILGLTPLNAEVSFRIVIHVALGILAVTIGTEFRFNELKKIGIRIIIIALVMIITTFILVFSAFMLMKFNLIFSLFIGIIACTTAPAVTLTVIKNLRVRGELIDNIYKLLSISDAIIFLIFGIVVSLVNNITSAKDQSTFNTIIYPILVLFISFGIGFTSGLILHFILKRMKKLNEILILSLGLIFFVSAISLTFHLSLILVNLSLGVTLINLSKKNQRLFRNRVMYPLMPPVYSLFYAIAGLSINIKFFENIKFLIGLLVYIVIRIIGKYLGVFFGTVIMRSDSTKKKYLGFTVFSQAGIAISLSLKLHLVSKLMTTQSELIFEMTNIILISVFINQLIGELVAYKAIKKATDID